MTRFIDYFFICGLNEREKPRVYTSYDDGVHNDCDSKLIPSVLCHYPRNVPENPWNPAELWKFCSPGGLWAGQSSTNQKPRFHSFLITREDGSRCYGHVLTFRERCVDRSVKQAVESILSMQPTKQLFVDKCLCFITQQAYINTCEQILRKLYVLFVSNTAPPVLPVESYLYNLLYEIPLVNEGSSLKLSCMGHDDPVVVQQPSSSELPLLDVYLSRVVHLLGGARNLVNLMTSLLLEHQILLVSEDCHKLTLVGEGITSLMFPFQWQHTIVTMLPYEVATHFFDAPVPYIIGVLANQNKKGLVRQALEVNQCYVDLDNHIVEWPEEQPTFPNDVEIIEKINSIIKVYNKEVKASSMTSSVTSLDNQPTMEATDVDLLKSNETVERVANIAHKVGAFQSMDEINSLHANILGSDGKQHMNESLLREHKLNASIRETLSSIFIVIFAQYDKFVIQYNEDMAGGEEFNPETQNNFDKISFLSDQPESRLRFLISFLDTQMFASFVDNFIVSCNNIHVKDPLLKLFDDRIDQSKLPIDVKSPSSA
uniref:UDENN domain-containing protein n=3 Tax=Ciona intestinalis TaxID=7719 RepID=F6SBQ3_CIOIN